jgi:hypothetical protein
VVEQPDQGQEMELSPLLTSVENWGVPGHFLRKIFFESFDGRDGGRNKKGLYLYMYGKWGVRDMISEKYFLAGGSSGILL